MLPAHESSPPIASTNLERWAQEEQSRKVLNKLLLHDQTHKAEKTKLAGQKGLDMRHEAYMSLLDCRIRNAWVSNTFGPKLTHFCLTVAIALFSLFRELEFRHGRIPAVYRPLFIKLSRPRGLGSQLAHSCKVRASQAVYGH